MAELWSRRRFVGAAATGLVAAGLSVACSRPETDQPGKPIRIRHLFGATVIEHPPTRVVSAGFTGQDDLLAVGVVPVAVTHWFGDQPFAVWPWAQPKLGGAKPEVLNLDNGIDVDAIAALTPDLIVAIDAGLDAATYTRLSEIAPTVPQIGEAAFFEPWRDRATTIGRAVLAGDQMQTLIDQVDSGFEDVAERFPQFAGRTAALLDGRLDRDGVVATLPGWRTEFLTRMGLQIADGVGEFDRGGRAVIPRDQIRRVLDRVDVLIFTTESDADQDALRADPDIGPLSARSVFTTADQAGAIAFASTLSYPVVAEQLPELIAAVL